MAENKTPEQLQAELDAANKALETEKAAHAKTKASSLKQVEQLQSKLQKTINSAGGKLRPTTTVDGVDYVARFASMKMPDGNVMSAEEIFADEALCRKLINQGSGLFKDIKADEARRNKEEAKKRLNRPRVKASEDDED